MARRKKEITIMAVVHRCSFCEGEIKKYQPSNPFCKRVQCFEMRMQHERERSELVHGKIIGQKMIGNYIQHVTEGGTRQSKAV